MVWQKNLTYISTFWFILTTNSPYSFCSFGLEGLVVFIPSRWGRVRHSLGDVLDLGVSVDADDAIRCIVLSDGGPALVQNKTVQTVYCDL